MALDVTYIPGLDPILYSLSLHAKGIDVVLVCPNDSIELKCQLERALDRFAIEGSVRVARPYPSLPVKRHVSTAAYLRWQLPQLLSDYGRILYLDVDAVPFANIEDLIFIDLKNHPVGCVQDPINPTIGSPLAMGSGHQPRNIAIAPYYNSGVLVIDPDLWRLEGVTERCLDLAMNPTVKMNFVDQDPFNLTIAGRALSIPLKYNTYPVEFYSLIARYDGRKVLRRSKWCVAERSAHILHFAGPLKPWMNDYPDTWASTRYRDVQDTAAHLSASSLVNQ